MPGAAAVGGMAQVRSAGLGEQHADEVRHRAAPRAAVAALSGLVFAQAKNSFSATLSGTAGLTDST